MSTITLAVERTAATAKPKPEAGRPHRLPGRPLRRLEGAARLPGRAVHGGRRTAALAGARAGAGGAGLAGLPPAAAPPGRRDPGGGSHLVSGGAQPREHPDRRAHRRRQHLPQARRGAAGGGGEVRRPDRQARLRRLDRPAPERVDEQAERASPSADAPDRLHVGQELHRLGPDHRRDGPALLRQRRAFALVSSDSDFTSLATRLRESGKTVYGLGLRKTPESLRNAWTGSSPSRTSTRPRWTSHARSRPTPRAPRRGGFPTCAGCWSAPSPAPPTTTAGRPCHRWPTT